MDKNEEELQKIVEKTDKIIFSYMVNIAVSMITSILVAIAFLKW